MPIELKTSYKYILNGAFALLLLTAVRGGSASGQETTLYNFRGDSDGGVPGGALISDRSGNVYGTTEEGGGGACENGCGLVFKLGSRGKETVLYAFAGGNDGAEPAGGLIRDNAGNFYGTTAAGGGTGCQEYGGCGTVYKLTPNGTESVLYAFQGGSDGWRPLDSLVADKSGNLYGTTGYGGNFNGSDCEQIGCGTVYEVQPSGTKLTLYVFQGGSDGSGPGGRVILDSAGNIYGTTGQGGGNCGCGTVFKTAPDGAETVLYAFKGGDDGAEPVGVTMDGAGNLYGATIAGGNCTFQHGGCGTVYRLAPDGTETVLYNFQGGDDGLEPSNALILDKKGNLYGTTFYSKVHRGCKRFGGCGTVFEVSRGGKETTLFDFKHLRGIHPYAPLLLGAHDELYGTTTIGGTHGAGVVFELKK